VTRTNAYSFGGDNAHSFQILLLGKTRAEVDTAPVETSYIDILASRRHNYISISVTGDLNYAIRNHRERTSRILKCRRVFQKLVYVEAVRGVDQAIIRERALKKWNIVQLGHLIESVNPCWESISLSALSKSGFSHIE
jgi:putative endonuclease